MIGKAATSPMATLRALMTRTAGPEQKPASMAATGAPRRGAGVASSRRASPGARRALPEDAERPGIYVHFEEHVGAGPLCKERGAALLDGRRASVTCPRCKDLLAAVTKRSDLEGVRFWAPLADASVQWLVVGRRAGDVWNAIVAEPIEEAGTPGHFTERQIHAYVSMDEFHARMRDEQRAYFAALPEGSIVHYHHGFGRWVRARAVRVDGETQLRPEALVGRWEADSQTSYWIDRFRETGAWRPHWTAIYESGKEGGRWKGDPGYDPRTAPAVVDVASVRATHLAGLGGALCGVHRYIRRGDPPVQLVTSAPTCPIALAGRAPGAAPSPPAPGTTRPPRAPRAGDTSCPQKSTPCPCTRRRGP
jgi:hypothetical protein